VDNVVSCDLTGSTNIDITAGVISATGSQNELTGGTNISIVDDVVSCDLVGSYNIDITDGVISTTGLQNELTAGTNITIASDVVSCDLTGSTNIDITDGVISTTGLQEELSAGTNISIVDNVVSCDLTGKQDTITPATYLTCNSLTTNQLIVNDDIYFNTIVIRRFDKSTSTPITLSELQCWVYEENIIFNNADILNGYFANWTNNDVPLDADGTDGVDPFMFNNSLEFGVSSSGSGIINALIIKNIPLTIVNDIQAIVLYNIGGGGDDAIGLSIELYNTNEDPNLTKVLANSAPLENGVRGYRFDFPSIGTYSLDFLNYGSTTRIPNITYDGSTWASI